MSARCALVTGSGSGIGRAVATTVASYGGRVVISGRNQSRLDAVQSELGASCVASVAGDLTDDEALCRLADSAHEHSVDLLVHSAAVFEPASVTAMDSASFERQLHINLCAPAALTRRLIPTLTDRSADIVFVNSTVVRGTGAGVGAYAASKRGLAAIADALRDEVNGLGIRVLSIYPGRTATPMQQRFTEDTEGRRYVPERLLQPEDVAASIVHAVTLPRTAEITELVVRPMQPPAEDAS